MKRLLSLALCGLLLAGLTLPAAAEEAADTADARLARVTQAVKELLNLNTDVYDRFEGSCQENSLAPVWSLFWSGGEEGSLSVEALEDGRIVSYRLGDYGISPARESGSLPAFPVGDQRAAKAAASAFLDKVLAENESVELGEPQGADYLDSSSCAFSGKLLLKGLPSPLTYSITVRLEDSQVIRFWRDAPDNCFLGPVPDPKAVTSQGQAAALLKGTLALRLEYVLPEKDAQRAVLRWLPEDIHRFAVDAGSGRLLDLTELEKNLTGGSRGENGAGDVAAPAAKAEASADSGGARLSAAEQAGIQKLEGVQTKEALDAALRAVEAYGLASYGLASANFSLEKGETEAEDTVLCALRYTRSAKEDQTHSRTITVDARTGEVQRIYSSIPWGEKGETLTLSAQQAQKQAETFLQSFCPDRAEKLDLWEVADQTEDGAPFYTFSFAQKENGAFFRENAYTVAIDGTDGSVCRLFYDWTDVAFDSPAGTLSREQAEAAWMKTYTVTLGYSLVPRQLDASSEAEARLIQQGMQYFYELRLTYALERENSLLGIDAKTGKAVEAEWESKKSDLRYRDLEGSAAKGDIETLAKYGVGYQAETFQPAKSLTQWDLVCLLASLQGYALDPAGADRQERDNAYRIAYSMGALTRGQRAEDAAVTRAELVRSLLDAAGYGPAARLKGIFTCAYNDQDAIPADGLGYAAIAQALGLAEGTYAGTRTAVRGEAASMLCRLLERQR